MMVDVSVIIATATGEEHLERCLASILGQEPADSLYELVVVIDGPNPRIARIVDSFRDRFAEAAVSLRISVLPSRQGRFAARLHAATLATAESLLIVDDRNILEPSFMRKLVQLRAEVPDSVVIPSLRDMRSPTVISRTLNLIRARAYKAWDGAAQESYWVDASNFERTAKGTGGLWVPRTDFIAVYRDIEKQATDPRYVSDDTKVLRGLLDRGLPMLKSGEVLLTYEPRTRFSQEVRHLYGRGPLFVDYYSRVGTRFFLPLVAGTALVLCGVLVAILWPWTLRWMAILLGGAVVLSSLALAERWSDLPKLVIGLPLVGVSFALGVVRGFVARAIGRRGSR